MADRDALIRAFLARVGWGAAARREIAGDASARRYERLIGDAGQSAILMDADPAKGEDIDRFQQVARHLTSLSLSAPAILAADSVNGFLLLEDLGDAVFARLIEAEPSREKELYDGATDLLLTLHQHPAPEWLVRFTPQLMTEQAGFAYSWYMRGAVDADTAGAAELRALPVLHALLNSHAAQSDVMILRDYHSENVIWLPERTDAARVGLLDFQDALAGHRAYDLVSFLQDVRRDVTPEVATSQIDRYANAAGLDIDAFSASCAVLGLQRNLRILGVFARLSLVAGKSDYIDLIPRVWAHIESAFDHPALRPARAELIGALPPPSPEILLRLKDQCPTTPTP
ncbi:aminoglycoside phosphotransferase family protein [Shimia biformata]|uniref:aminoglycoside phosphotransferase family protein n=1 Tax=Shimia biformata TaxID=1294299 RepID=UPI00195160F1|nr:phosphotransferase [Shimia biformata]